MAYEEEEEDSIYGDEYLEEASEDDEIDELEEGFMKGYDEEDTEVCNKCGKVLIGYEDTVEIEFGKKTYKFCSQRCAEKFRKKHDLG
ncbi:hypothetical protein HYX18_04205 [Candidatus Woesearchaeota archaeon]|nr:hypothetical protein [Candidatus Woesearchaeota archaeon]